jgi:hypothetical protein
MFYEAHGIKGFFNMLWNNKILIKYFNYILGIFSLFNSWHPIYIELNYNFFFITLHIIFFLHLNWRQMEIMSPKYKCIEVVSYFSNLWCENSLIYNFSFIGNLIKIKIIFLKKLNFTWNHIIHYNTCLKPKATLMHFTTKKPIPWQYIIPKGYWMPFGSWEGCLW